MPIRRYVEKGVVFSPEALSAMSKAYEAAIWTLGPGCDEMKREAVAKVIIQLAQEGNFDTVTLHRRAVAAISDPSVAALVVESQQGRPAAP